MSFQISTAFVKQFRDELLEDAQQKISRLRSKIRVDSTMVGDSKYVERIGTVEMFDFTGTRHGASPAPWSDANYDETPHMRRRLDLRNFDWGDALDKHDEPALLVNPRNKYRMAGTMAAGRQIDRTILEAALGTAATLDQDQTETLVPWATDAPSGHIIGDNLTPLTVDKVRDAKQALDEQEVPEEDRCACVTAKGIMDLLQDEQVTSSDYNTIKALVSGTVVGVTWMGFEWIRTQLVNVDTDEAQSVFFHRDALELGINLDADVEISKRPDLKYAWYVYVALKCGAVRVDPARMVEVKYKAT